MGLDEYEPKPLRGKINFEMLVYSDNSNFGDRDRVIEQYKELAKAIKSAVGCLKERVKKDQTERNIMKSINYCFEDVVDTK